MARKKIDADALLSKLDDLMEQDESPRATKEIMKETISEVKNLVWLLQNAPRFEVCIVSRISGEDITTPVIVQANTEARARREYARTVPSFSASGGDYRTSDFIDCRRAPVPTMKIKATRLIQEATDERNS